MNENEPLSFRGLGIAPGMLAALEKLKFTTPTPIQAKAIPVGIAGEDLIGIAQTGTGKTFAFGIPMMQRIAQTRGQGLVVLPTRELALQVDVELRKIGMTTGLRTAVLIGGLSMGPQISAIRRGAHIIIATPGRLNDHLEQKTISLNRVNCVALDEADRMLDMGFLPQIKSILDALPKERQTLLFSATMPTEIVKIANTYMKTPLRIEVAPAGTTAERVTQELFIVSNSAKLPLLEHLLREHKGPTLVFTRTKHGATKITRKLIQSGVNAAEIHANRTLGQRREALEGFKRGKYRVLIATDIASRGIDVKGIETVINFDLPTGSDDYVHRIGRTARAGEEGHAISFAMPDQRKEVAAIERLIRSYIPTSPLPSHIASMRADTRPRPTYTSAPGARSGGRPQSRPPARRFGGRR